MSRIRHRLHIVRALSRASSWDSRGAVRVLPPPTMGHTRPDTYVGPSSSPSARTMPTPAACGRGFVFGEHRTVEPRPMPNERSQVGWRIPAG